MRLYYDLDKKDPILKDLCDLTCLDNNIDICDTKNLPGTPFVSHFDKICSFENYLSALDF